MKEDAEGEVRQKEVKRKRNVRKRRRVKKGEPAEKINYEEGKHDNRGRQK